MNRYNNPNELYHYGIPGMKWGRRKQRVRSEDSKRLKQVKKKRIKELSNQELKDANNRMRLENEYRNLRDKTNAGKRALNSFVRTSGLITGVAAAVSVYSKYGGKAKEATNTALKKIGSLTARAFEHY